MTFFSHPATRTAGWLLLLGCVVASLGFAGAEELPVLLVSWMIVFYLWICWTRYRDHPADFLEADIVFLFFFGIYLVLPFSLYTFLNFGLLELQIPLRALICGVAGLIGVGAGMLFPWAKNIVALGPAWEKPWQQKQSRRLTLFLFAVGGLLLAGLVATIGVGSYTDVGYAETYAAEAGYGYLSIGIIFVQLGLFVLFLTEIKTPTAHSPRVVWLLFILYALLSLRIGRRRMVLESGMGLLVLRHSLVKRFSARRMLILGVFAAMLFTVVGQARSALEGGLAAMTLFLKEDFSADQMKFVLAEPETVTLALTEIVAIVPAREDYRYGGTIWDAFVIMIPNAIYPGRPLAPSQWFVWQYDPDVARAGGGYSFALIAEGYMNFGYLGAFLVCFLEGLFFRVITDYRRAAPHSKSRNLIYAVVISYTVSFIRGDFATLLKAFFFAAALPAAVIAFVLGSPRFEAWINGRADNMFSQNRSPNPIL